MKVSGKIVDVHYRRIYPGEISIYENRIAEIREVNQAQDQFIIPGFIDAHVHIESSMMVPSHFAVAVVRHGTTGVVADPHEIANVMGMDGIKFMMEDAAKVPVKFMFGAPSCVPATSLESAGARLGPEEISELVREDGIGFLGEMMNFPGVINNDAEVHQKLEIARQAGIPVDGHAPGLTGEKLQKYISAGITTDHECTSLDEAIEKIGRGMKIMIREGSAARNLEALAPLIALYPAEVMLCTDDMHPDKLLKGHINKLVARLIELGYDIFDVLRAASVNAAEHYRMNVGLLRVDDPADFIITDDLYKMNVVETWTEGKCVFSRGKVMFPPGEVMKINRFISSALKPGDIRVVRQGERLRVIVARNGELFTGSETVSSGTDKYVNSRPVEDVLKIIVKERYRDAVPAVGFIKGFGLKQGAVASSVAHDSHNIIAVGVDDREIIRAINLIINAGGGMAVVSDGDEQLIRLPVAGIMSDMPVTAMAQRYERLTETARSIGCRMDAPFMTLSFMALLVIPELKMSDSGLFDGLAFRHVPLFI